MVDWLCGWFPETALRRFPWQAPLEQITSPKPTLALTHQDQDTALTI